MRLFLAGLLFVLAGPALADGPQPSRLRSLNTGDDTRGWEAVGRLDMGRGSFCTGALISPRLVLTAAHCLFSKQGEPIDLDQIEFLAGWRNGRAEAYRGVRRAATHPDYVYGKERQVARVSTDVALVELDQPIRSARITPFETGPRLRKGEEVGIVSYAEDRAEAPSLQRSCHVMERLAGVAMLSCSVDFGSSGAPIFSFLDGKPTIVSVVSSKAEAKGQPVALAGELRGSIEVLKGELPEAPTAILRGGGAFNGSERSGGGTGAKFVRP